MEFKLEIEKAEYRPIGNSWDGNTYLNQNWRFYHNDSTGSSAKANGTEYPFIPNRCQMIAPGTLFVTEQKKDITQFYAHFTISPNQTVAKPGVYEIDFDKSLQALLNAATQNMSKSDSSLFSDRGLSLVSSVCGYAFAQLPDSVFSPTKFDPRIQEAMTKMESAPHLAHSIEDMARELGLCRSAFIRLFKSQTGTSPYALLSEFRMTLAKELLAFGDESIETISQSTGFRDRFHFSRIFKQKTGTSPARFRKERRN